MWLRVSVGVTIATDRIWQAQSKSDSSTYWHGQMQYKHVKTYGDTTNMVNLSLSLHDLGYPDDAIQSQFGQHALIAVTPAQKRHSIWEHLPKNE